MKLFSIGEKIWFLSIILYIIWVIIGLKSNVQISLISIYGSLGMLVFVVLINLIRIKLWK